MAWDALEWVYVEAEFLELGGGEIWDRVEWVAWQQRENERAGSSQKKADYRSRLPERLAHRADERRRRQRNKTVDNAVRCCAVCRRMYVVSKQRTLDGTRFCSPRCAALYRHKRRGGVIRVARTATIDGKTRTVLEWAKLHGLKRETVYQRIRQGMTPEQAVTTPLIPQRERRYPKNREAC